MSALVVLLWVIVAVNLIRVVRFVGRLANAGGPVPGAGAAVLVVIGESVVVALAALALAR